MQTRTVTLELTDLQIELLRRWIDQAPSNPYVPMVASILPQLPLNTDAQACDDYLFAVLHKSAANRSSADSAPAASQVPESAGGFQFRAWTPSGKEALPDILRRLLATTPTPTYFPTDCKPHGESL